MLKNKSTKIPRWLLWPNKQFFFCNSLSFCHEIPVSGLTVTACAPVSENKYFVQLLYFRISLIEMGWRCFCSCENGWLMSKFLENLWVLCIQSCNALEFLQGITLCLLYLTSLDLSEGCILAKITKLNSFGYSENL